MKFSPAIADRTASQLENDEQGMEAVLFDKKARRHRQHHRSKKHNEDCSGSEDDETSAIFESPQNTVLLDLIRNRKWEKLLFRLLKDPHIAHVKFTGRSANSTAAGNLVLHEACKYNAPTDVVDALVEANDKAVSTKGYAGYLPLHCACAHGGSIELIRLLQSLHPEATTVVDDDDGALPLHLACKIGTMKEGAYMCLLTSYPEGSNVRDDFGRLPIDYAKNIQSDAHRKIVIECLKRASWLESAARQAKQRTESEYQHRIQGYEQFQAQRLKMIEGVHTTEIAKFEDELKLKEEELLEKSKDLQVLDQHLREKTDEFEERVESVEHSLKAKNRKLQTQVDKAKKEAVKAQTELDEKTQEVADLSKKLDEAKELIESLSEQLEQRTDELDVTLDDMETLNKHSEWLESVLESIRKLSVSESPVSRSLHQKDTDSEIMSIGTNKLRTLSADDRLKQSDKISVGAEKRDPSFVGRIFGSRRE